MVSKASEDLPEPLRPVMTTSLSRGIFNVRFLRLCSRAPPILMNSLLTDPKTSLQTIGKFTGKTLAGKGGSCGGRDETPDLVDCQASIVASAFHVATFRHLEKPL